MRWFGNAVHLLTGGLVLASAWLLAAVVLYPFRETRPLAGPCLQCALFQLSPGGRELVRETEVAAYREYVRTGRLAPPLAPGRTLDRETFSTLVLWAPFGIVLATGHLLHSLLIAVLRLSAPWQSPSFSVLAACRFPGGWLLAPACGGRARVLTPKQRRWSKTVAGERLAGMAGPGLRLQAFGAALTVWASVSTSGSLFVTSSEPLYGQSLKAGTAQYSSGSAEAATGPIGRPRALPALAIGGGSPLVETADGCQAPGLQKVSSRLSRRHPSFALPLGSRPVSLKSEAFAMSPLDRIAKLTKLSASVRNARTRRQPCAKAVASHAFRSAAYAADRALFFRLAAKTEPHPLGSDSPSGRKAGSLVAAHDHLSKLHRFLASTSPAKAPNPDGTEDAAERIARAISIL